MMNRHTYTQTIRDKSIRRDGFSLIELSIVLAVVALLLSGIIAGTEVIRGAKVRATLSQTTEIMTAIEQFEELYRYLPGDLLNAEDYWGTDCTDPIADCNGNGNWEVEFSGGETEDHRVFQHLTLANLYKKGTSFSASLVPGSSIPESPFTGGGFWFADYDGMHDKDQGNALILAAREDDDALDAGLLAPRIVYEMDQKMDDGEASTGYLQAAFGEDFAEGCVDGAWAASGVDYLLNDETDSCRLAFFFSLRP